MKNQLITTHLWFDKEAKEAAELYTAIFDDSKIGDVTTINDTPSGSADILNIELAGQDFVLLNGGPYFKFTPAISLLVACKSDTEVEAVWSKLIAGGSSLMELGKYPFSDKYGWLKDRFGLSWQIMHMGEREIKEKIIPTLMFVGDVYGKAEEAINSYVSIFDKAKGQTHGESKIGEIMRYGVSEEPDQVGMIKHAGFTLQGQAFAAMDSAHEHEFKFTEAISFIVHCENQEEIDYYWEKLSAVPLSEQCGWLKDKFGVSWQIVPTVLDGMLKDSDKKASARVTKAFLKMKKFNISELQKAYQGK